MNHHQTLSSYLVKPDFSPRWRRGWQAFRTQISTLRRTHPRVAPRLAAALLIWGALAGSVDYIISRPSLPSLSSFTASTQTPPPSAPVVRTATLAAVAKAQELPSGPSGELLPPGTMAPDRTYANNYVRGQCTWYVAGRRPVPANWSDAKNWYWRALSSGWSVGSTPAVAAIAWTSAGFYGHVALVEQVSADGAEVYISEMNYRGPYIKSYRWVNASSFKYIY